MSEHNTSQKGAAYTSTRRPVTLRYNEPATDRSNALKRERAIKRLGRIQKLELIEKAEV